MKWVEVLTLAGWAVLIMILLLSQYIKITRQNQELSQCKFQQDKELSTLLKAYVECISSEDVPSIQSAVQLLSNSENSRAVAAAETRYKELMDKVKLPTNDADELLQHHIQSEKAAIDVFTQHFFLDENMEFQNEMKAKIQSLYEQYCRENEKESEKKCRAVLNEVTKELEKKLKKNEYVKPGGYTMYCFDRDHAEEAYLAAPGKGVKREVGKETQQPFKKGTEQQPFKTARHVDVKVLKLRASLELDECNGSNSRWIWE
ncbi:guanylate-binding protein 1-like [Protopterus annectens]|uniref:guanylate-binding protein 1-like n=1 Tax=Protopterus annectens TaxID=7888 RepID=UPI001CFB5DD0|nr:guanylate-binding protein 1-like [Protopterus annectens]